MAQNAAQLPAQPEQLANLFRWATKHGAKIHPSIALELTGVEGTSFVVMPGRDLKKNEDIVSCVPNLMLSYLNAACSKGGEFGAYNDNKANKAEASPLPDKFLKEVPPHVIGRFFLMQQFMLGEESFWHPYIDTLPPPPPSSVQPLQKGGTDVENDICEDVDCGWTLPPFWTAGERKYLQGTNVGAAIDEIRRRVSKEYIDAIEVLKQCDGEQSKWVDMFPQSLYQWAYCIFSSRSFRPSLVLPLDTLETALQSDGVQEGTKPDDFSILLPLFDIGNHHPRARVEWDVVASEDARGGKSKCVLRTPNITHEGGSQVYNWYGNKTNAELLVGYGFITAFGRKEKTHNAYVHLRKAHQMTKHNLVHEDRDFLVSLKSMWSKGTIIKGKTAMLVPREKIKVHGFAHFDQGMIWDILVNGICGGDIETVKAIWGVEEEGHEPRMVDGVDVAVLEKVLGTFPFPNEDAQQIVVLVLNVLIRKVCGERDKLEHGSKKTAMEEEAGPREVNEAKGETARLKLIADYRREVRWVLQAAEASITTATERQHPVIE